MVTTSSTTLETLRAVNPVSNDERLSDDERDALRSRVADAIAMQDASETYASPSRRIADRGSVARRRWIATGAAIVAVSVAVTPAFGLGRSFIPFFGADKAPKAAQLDFASLKTGAPAGMNPRAMPGQARQIMEAHFAGADHDLWVSPTDQGGFCYEWTPGYGGCDASGTQPLDAFGDIVPAPGVKVTPPPPGGTLTGSQAGRALATIPTWVAGFIRAGKAQTVTIRFKDGSTIKPGITWVSSPINAGFFTYDVPTGKQAVDNHVVAVDAVGGNGSMVQEQVLSPDHG